MKTEDALIDCVALVVTEEVKRAGLQFDTDEEAMLTDLTLRHVERVGAHDARELLRSFLDPAYACGENDKAAE